MVRRHEMLGDRPKARPSVAAKPPVPKDLAVVAVGRSLLSGQVLTVGLNRDATDMELASIAAHLRSWSPSADDPEHLAALICTRCKRPYGRHDGETKACPNGSGEFSS